MSFLAIANHVGSEGIDVLGGLKNWKAVVLSGVLLLSLAAERDRFRKSSSAVSVR